MLKPQKPLLHTIAFWFVSQTVEYACIVPSSHCLYNFRFLVTGLYFWHVYWLAAVQPQVREMHMLHVDAVCTYIHCSLSCTLQTGLHACSLSDVFCIHPFSSSGCITSLLSKKKSMFYHVSRRTSQFTVTTFGPDTRSSEAHWTFVRPDNYTYRREVGLERGRIGGE